MKNCLGVVGIISVLALVLNYFRTVDPDHVVGKWRYVYTTIGKSEVKCLVEFKPNRTYSYSMTVDGRVEMSISGSWEKTSRSVYLDTVPYWNGSSWEITEQFWRTRYGIFSTRLYALRIPDPDAEIECDRAEE